MNKARITYRFEHGQAHTSANLNNEAQWQETRVYDLDKPKAEKKPAIEDAHYLNQFTSDFGAWQSPFDIETEKLEDMIRHSERSVGQIPVEKKAKLPLLDQPYDDKQRHYGPEIAPEVDMEAVPRYVRHARRSSWPKMLFSFSSAVATGALLGFFVLSFFSDEGQTVETGRENPLPIVESQDTSEGLSGTADPVASDQSNKPIIDDPVDQQYTVTLPGQTYFLIQNGVFSSLESANKAIAALEQQGFAPALVEKDNFIVLAGMVSSRDDALALSYLLEQKEFETYISSFEIPSVQIERSSQVEADEFLKFAQHSSELVKALSSLSLIHVQEATPKTLADSSLQAIKNIHQAFLKQATVLGQILPADQQSTLQKMNRHMDTAMSNLNEYAKNPSSSYQWEIQAACMEYMIQYSELVRQLATRST